MVIDKNNTPNNKTPAPTLGEDEKQPIKGFRLEDIDKNVKAPDSFPWKTITRKPFTAPTKLPNESLLTDMWKDAEKLPPFDFDTFNQEPFKANDEQEVKKLEELTAELTPHPSQPDIIHKEPLYFSRQPEQDVIHKTPLTVTPGQNGINQTFDPHSPFTWQRNRFLTRKQIFC